MSLTNKFLELSRSKKRILMLLADLIFLPLAWLLALSLRYGEWWPMIIAKTWWFFIAIVAIAVPIFIRLGLYRAVIRYMGEQVISTVASGVALTTLILSFITLLTGTNGIPRSSFFIFFGTAFLLVAGSRFLMRNYYNSIHKNSEARIKVAIYGAGDSGFQIATALLYGNSLLPIAFIDDNPSLWGATLHGIRVNNPKELPNLIKKLEINMLLLAMPNLKRTRRFDIVKSMEKLPISVRTMPNMADLVSGQISADTCREIELDELLGRDPVAPYNALLYTCIQGKAVLVTGAGGSIGSELCRQILKLAPKLLVLFDISEYLLYQIEYELREIMAQHTLKLDLFAIIGSIQDKMHVDEVLKIFSIQTIYHAAAYKHVPLVEYNFIEGVRNNILGTQILAELAIINNIKHFVLISTDKAVRPTSVMGATKRFAELILQALVTLHTETNFCMVRFGNVLGSSGSVVPLFRQQINAGGPITLTHKDIIRYFMTIPEAAQLVIQAGAMAQGGDVFVLDMGNPIRIYDLACTMVRLNGLDIKDESNPDGDIEIVINGLRPGEKLYEELLVNTDAKPTIHPLIMRAYEEVIPWNILKNTLFELKQACDIRDLYQTRGILQRTLTEYTASSEIVDLIWTSQQNRIKD